MKLSLLRGTSPSDVKRFRLSQSLGHMTITTWKSVQDSPGDHFLVIDIPRSRKQDKAEKEDGETWC